MSGSERDDGGPAAPAGRRFFLAAPHDPARPRLVAGEVEHAVRVLRLRPGERILGLDGRGGTWPLRVVAAGRGGLELAAAGELQREPEPGEPGAALPRIEVAVAWPKGSRGEAMLDALVQLGCAAVHPLACRRTGPQRTPDERSDGRRARLERVLREACKQSRRAWLPELGATLDAAQLVELAGGASLALLDPDAGLPLDTWARSLLGLPAARRHAVLAIGPEGGFDDEERDALLVGGAVPVRMGPHVLRIEVAAVAAAAIVGSVLG